MFKGFAQKQPQVLHGVAVEFPFCPGPPQPQAAQISIPTPKRNLSRSKKLGILYHLGFGYMSSLHIQSERARVCETTYPKHSMYGIFAYIGVVSGVNVGIYYIYSIHGVSGYHMTRLCTTVASGSLKLASQKREIPAANQRPQEAQTCFHPLERTCIRQTTTCI